MVRYLIIIQNSNNSVSDHFVELNKTIDMPKNAKKDEYNPYIGTMVALCKVTHLAIPDWVKNH